MLLVLVGFLSVIFSASGRLCWVCFARIRKEPRDWLWFPSHASCWSRSPFCSSDSAVLRNHQHPDEVNKGRVLSSICPAEIPIPQGLVSYRCALTGSVAACRAAGSGPKTSGAFTRSAGCRGGSGVPGAESQCQGKGGKEKGCTAQSRRLFWRRKGTKPQILLLEWFCSLTKAKEKP